MSVSLADADILKEVKELCDEVISEKKDSSILNSYSWLSVRVGGWNAPFVTFSADQQNDYLKRIIKS